MAIVLLQQSTLAMVVDVLHWAVGECRWSESWNILDGFSHSMLCLSFPSSATQIWGSYYLTGLQILLQINNSIKIYPFYSILLKQQFYYYYFFYLAFITEIWKEPCRFSVSVSSYPEFLSRAASPYPSPTCSQLAHYQKIVQFIPFSFSHEQSLLLWITNVRKTNKQT